jgi:tetratricopeptide (TPR) repeat protein
VNRAGVGGMRPTLEDLVQRASDPGGTRALVRAFRARREADKAADVLRRETRLDPARPEWFFQLAVELTRQFHSDEAIDVLRRGLALRYDAGGAATLSGLYLKAGNDAAAAETAVEALRRAPERWEPYAALCDLLVAEHTVGEIEARVARLLPTMSSGPMRIGLAHALEQVGRYPEAGECWTQALCDAPGHPFVQIRTAEAQIVLGNIDGAAGIYDQALALHPQNFDVVIPYAKFQIRRGRIQELWERVPKPQLPAFSRYASVRHPETAPYWDGAQPLEGKTVLMECDGGYGDVLQSVRFAAWLKERGASVVLDVPPRLVDLLRTMTIADEVVAPYEECRTIDYQCTAAYPTFFGGWSSQWLTDNTPYLDAEPARRRAWNERFDRRRLNVGLVWRSKSMRRRDPYTNRSVPLAEFRPLAAIPGVTLYGLQVGPGAEEVTADTRSWLAANLEAETKDFREAAAAIAALDAVVTADCGLAHLTGALGTPGFMLLPRYQSWRWMSAAPEFAGGTAWYPSTRLFTQERAGDWSGPMQQVVEAVRSLALARTQ